MPLRFRPTAALAAVLALSGCDSNSSSNALEDLDGTYTVDQLLFDPVTGDLSNADVAARLDSAATTLEIFGSDDEALLRIRFDDEAGSRRTDLRATARRGRVTFEAVTAEDESDLDDLFLPRQFTLLYDTDSRTPDLTGDLPLSDVNLEAFDPDRYQDQTSVRGTLRVRLARDLGD